MAWLDRYHVDGLRVDAVASMLYLDYSRPAGQWIPNRYGGRENLEAIDFLRQLNTAVQEEYPGVATYAEESTAWPMVTSPVHLGGLGFSYKWDMGWMHDTLRYFGRPTVYRRFHHHELTFRTIYATSERFVLPLSHDEVVHGKGSLLNKMPGDDWQQRANLRLLYAWQWAQTGKTLLFMGGELGQRAEWAHEGRLEWWRLDTDGGAGIALWVTDLNALMRSEPALHTDDGRPDAFRWVEADDAEESVFSFVRQAPDARPVLVVLNATPMPAPEPPGRRAPPRPVAGAAQQRRPRVRRQRRGQRRRRRHRADRGARVVPEPQPHAAAPRRPVPSARRTRLSRCGASSAPTRSARTIPHAGGPPPRCTAAPGLRTAGRTLAPWPPTSTAAPRASPTSSCAGR